MELNNYTTTNYKRDNSVKSNLSYLNDKSIISSNYTNRHYNKDYIDTIYNTTNTQARTNLANHNIQTMLAVPLQERQQASWTNILSPLMKTFSVLTFLCSFAYSGYAQQCTRVVSNTDFCQGGNDYVFYADGESWREQNLSFTECGNDAYLTGTMIHIPTGHVWSLDAVLGGKTTTAPNTPKPHQCHSYNANGWIYYTTLTGSIKNLTTNSGLQNFTRRGPAFQMGVDANISGADNSYGGSGWLDFTSGSGYATGDINITISSSCSSLNAGSISGNETNCGGFNPNTISSSSNASGGSGSTISYRWQKSTNGGSSWSTISGITTSSYNPGTISSTTLYRRQAKLADCSTWISSNNVTKTVNTGSTAPGQDYRINNVGWTTSNNVAVSPGDKLELGLVGASFSGWTFNWSGPASFSSSSTSNDIVVISTNMQSVNAGTYTLNYTDNGGCSGSLNYTVTVNAPNPQPTDWSYACSEGKYVEVIGKGTDHNTNTTLNFSNTSTINQIVVEAIHKNGTPPASMTFTSNLGQTIVATKQNILNANGSVNTGLAVYRAIFPASSSITLTTSSPSTTWSFVAYIHRSGGANQFSSGRYVSTFFYRTSKTEIISMPATVGTKDINIVIPITELNFDSRIATVTASAGGVSNTFTVQQPNLGESLNIQTLTLANVPGSATSVTLTVTSPNSGGDSFTAGGALTVNYTCNTAENCSNGVDDDGDGFIDCADPDCKPTISNVVVDDPSCPANNNDGKITITATSGSSGGSLEYTVNGGASWQANNVFFGLAAGTYNIQVRDLAAGCTASWGNNPVTINAPNCVCSASDIKTLVEWKIGSCAYDSDYSEFTPNIPSGVNCAITASTIHRNSGSHSCNSGRPGNPDSKAFCVASFNNSATSFNPNDSKAVRFTVDMPTNTVGSLTKFRFWTAAGRSGSSADFGLAVYKNGTLIYQNTNHTVSTTWTLEEFNLSGDPDFVYTGGEEFEFVMVPYNISGTTSFLWELDEFSVDGCCGPGVPPPSTCAPADLKKLIQWDVATCQAFSGAYDYSEFVASTPAGLDCQLSGTNLYRDNPNPNHHSCNPGRAAGDGYAFCIGGFNSANYISGSDKALKFKVTIPAMSSGSIYKLNFWGVGQNPTPYIGASSANNNYPTKYGVRVLKNGTEIYEQSGFGIEQLWTLEEVVFGSDPDFAYTGGEEFEFQMFAYDPIGNGYPISVWDLDEFSLTGCCASTVVCGSITNVTPSNPSNCGVNDGSIAITASGYSGTLQYSIDGGLNWQNSNTFSGLAAGGYNVAVRNADGSCITQYPNNPVQLVAPSSPVVSSVQATDPTECGVCDGQISIFGTGGSGSLQYKLNNGAWQSSGVFSGLCGGSYIPKVRNTDGSCEVAGPAILLIDPTLPVISGVVATDPIECGQNTGTITVDASGTSALEYSIDNGSTWQPSNVFVNLAPGNYTVKVRNSNGSCQVTWGSNPVVINSKVQPVITSIVPTNPSNCGLSDGQIVVNATGPSGTLEYSIDGGFVWQSSSTFPNLPGATYFVSVRYVDETCEVSGGTVTLIPPSAPVIQNVQSSNPTDCGVNDGTITIIATNNLSTIEYSIDGGSNWSSNSGFTGLTAGTYQIRVRNVGGTCEVSYPDVVLTAPTQPNIVNVAGTDPTNCGLMDGTITITASHPSSPLEYSIDNGTTWQASNVFINLDGGNYNIKVRLVGGACDVSGGNVTLTDKSAPTLVSVTPTDPSNCGTTDGEICINATGSSIEYSINGGANWQTQNCFDNLPAGTYTVLVRNADGTCEVANPNNPVILDAPNAPTVSATSSTDPTDCSVTDGTITVTATGSGSLEYKLEGVTGWQSSNMFTGLAGGTYTIKVRNAGDGSCEVTGGVEILENKVAPTYGNTVVTDPTDCGLSDGTITVYATGSGALMYSIDGGTTWQPSNYFDNLAGGNYDIRIRNADGTCEITAPAEVLTNPTPPSITSVTPTDPTDCNTNDGKIVITTTANGTVEYSIDGGINWQNSGTFNGLQSGTYNIVVRYVTGTCVTYYNTNPVVLVAPSAPTILGVTGTDPSDCGQTDGTITILAQGSGTLEYMITGSAWQSSNMFGSLAAGTYNIKVRNAGGTCEVVAAPITLEDKVAPSITDVNSTDPTECGINDGTITITASSSVGNALEYSINGGSTWQASNIFIGLQGNMAYQIRVRNADATCMVSAIDVNLISPQQPVITAVIPTDPTDCDLADGSILITATGSSLEYSIDGGLNWKSNGNFQNLPSGTYNIVVRNATGSCVTYWNNNPVILTAPSAPVILGTQFTDPTDCGVNDGTITILAQGGIAPLEYKITGSAWQTNNVFSNLAAGTYNISIRNDGGSCEVVTAPVILTAPIQPVISDVNFTDPTECNVNDGTITITASGAGALEFSIDNGANWQAANIFVGLAGGTYQPRVRNIDGSCLATYADIILTAPVQPVINSVVASDPTNCGVDDGTITINATGANLEYSIDGGINWQLSSVFPSLAAGTYNAVVRNVDGSCETLSTDNPIVLGTPTSPTILNVVSTDPTECGVDDGTITITAIGGTGTYQYSIDGGGTWQGSNTFTGLAAANSPFEIAVRNSDGTCMVIAAPVILVAPVAPVISNVDFTDPTDCGLNDGTITITASSAQGTVEYSINGGTTWEQSGLFVGLGAGIYEISVRNIAGNCKVDNPDVTLTAPIQPVITNVTPADPSNCGVNDGSILIAATGGSGTLEYSIDGGVNWQTSSSFNGLGAGVYNVITRYTGGTCETAYANNPVVLTAPSAPSIFDVTYTDPDECGVNNGTITIDATGTSGTLEYSIDGGLLFQPSNVFINLSAVTYNIIVRYNDETCPVTYPPVVLTAPVLPTITNVDFTNVTDCGLADGTITVTATGGGPLAYSIDGGATWQPSNIFSGLGDDTYDVRVRNLSGNCEVTAAPVTITAPTPTNVASVATTDPSDCGVSDGQIVVTATGGILEYSIDGGTNWQSSNTFNGLAAGTYNVAVRNTNGTCFNLSIDNPIILSTPTSPSITNVASTDPTDCNLTDGTITITATGGQGTYEYSIDGGGPAGTWQSSNTFTGLAGGSYEIHVRNASGSCDVLGPVEVLTDKIPPVVSSTAHTQPADCGVNDGTITITASSAQGTVEYSINGGSSWQQSGVFTGLAAGSYQTSVRNIDGTCKIDDALITLVAPIPPVISSVTPTDPTNCGVDDGTITIVTTGGNGTTEYSIDGGQTWQQNGGTYTGLAAGTYFVWVRNSSGTCEVAETANPIILQPASAPAITNVAHTDPTDCNVTDGTITVTVTGGQGTYQYSKDGGSTWQASNVFTSLAGGSYDIHVRNANETCEVNGPIEVLIDKVAPVISNVDFSDPTDCGVADGTITIIANSPISSAIQYSIDGGTTWQSSNLFVGLVGGTYDIRVRNADGTCMETGAPVTLTDKIQPTVDDVVSTDPTNCDTQNGTITVTASGNNIVEFSIDGGLNWQPTGNFTGLAAGSYNVAIRYTDNTCFVLDADNPVIIGAPAAPSIINVASTDPTDCTVCDGTITMTATGGQGTYEYSNDGGATWQSSNVFTALCGGSYDMAIRNANETCVVLGSTEVLEDKVAPTIASVSSTSPTECSVADGTITVIASSSAGNPLEYSIDGGLSWQSSNLFVGLIGDTYEIRVRNADGTCMEAAPNEVLIDKISPIIEDVVAVPPSDCNLTDGTITITATAGSGAVEYSIDGGINWSTTGSFTNLAPGSYNVFIRNADGTCVVANTLAAANNGLNNNTNASSGYNPVIIAPPTAPAITNVASTNPTDCNVCDGTITITATGTSGSFEYSIDGGLNWQASNVFTGVCGGANETMVRNTGGSCQTVGPIEVLEDKVPPIFTTAVGTDPSDCGAADGTIIVTANSPIGNA